jgi:hypothetical protein
MKTKPITQDAERSKTSYFSLDDSELIYEYPEPENNAVRAGSTQLLDDFLEFTDFLVPTNRIISMYRYTKQSIVNDQYSEFLSF